jgi:membrane protein
LRPICSGRFGGHGSITRIKSGWGGCEKRDVSSAVPLFRVIVVISWLVLLLGAVINAVLGGYYGADEDTDDGTEHEALLTCDELADYLRDLHEGVTGRYERMRPATTDGWSEFSRPAGHIDVTEGEVTTDDGTERFVTHRWRVPSEEAGDEPVAPKNDTPS